LAFSSILALGKYFRTGLESVLDREVGAETNQTLEVEEKRCKGDGVGVREEGLS
jgi:hypothetical protein